MEFGRFEQLTELADAGWSVDDECQRLQHANLAFGGPTYMKNPDGLVYAVTSGEQELLSGIYKTILGEYTPGVPDSGTTKSVVYAVGRPIAVQG